MNKNTDHNNDYEYIRSKFDSDGIEAPASLSEDRILSMLEDRTVPAQSDLTPAAAGNAAGSNDNSVKFEFASAQESRRAKWFEPKRWIAAAACLMIGMFAVMQVYDSVTAPPDTVTGTGELYTFKSEAEIRHLVDSLDKSDSRPGYYVLDGGGEMGIVEDADMAAEDAPAADGMLRSNAKSSASNATGAAASADHSDTYLQVDDVDEADIVKTDGKYIYYVTDSREVVILSAENGKTRQMSRVGSSEVENYIHDIYLKGDILVTVGRFYDEDEGYTGIVTYDISDRSDPKLMSTFRQTGEIISSRMVGNYVYLITSDYVWKGGRIVPKCTIDGVYKEMDPTGICCVPEPDQSSYVVLSSLDITSGKDAKTKTTAIFGATDDIYCNDHNLYAAVREWDFKTYETYTRIARASIDGLKIRWNGSARVRGFIDNQFSMDEKDGYFRIATTGTRDGIDVNNLFVLDKDLKEAGKITGFARNESIKAVRYFGDKAYVITYEAIDPLFIIDLSDPTSPKIDGEVKIDGFSTLLIPAGEGRLLGIGHATGDNGYGGEYASGLKLVMFDISNPSQPKVISSKEFKDMDSPAQNTHKALTVNTKEGWYAVPYEIYHYDEEPVEDAEVPEDEELVEDAEVPEDEDSTESEDTDAEEIEDDVYVEPSYESGVLVFGSDDKLTVFDQHKIGDRPLMRSVYIGDYIYALDAEGNASSFKFTR